MFKPSHAFLLTLLSSLAVAQSPAQLPGSDNNTAIAANPMVGEPLQLEIKEWPVPWEDTRPRDPDVAPNGVIWLVGQGGDYAARLILPTSGSDVRNYHRAPDLTTSS